MQVVFQILKESGEVSLGGSWTDQRSMNMEGSGHLCARHQRLRCWLTCLRYEVAAEYLGNHAVAKLNLICTAITLEVAAVGLTEEQAREKATMFKSEV